MPVWRIYYQVFRCSLAMIGQTGDEVKWRVEIAAELVVTRAAAGAPEETEVK